LAERLLREHHQVAIVDDLNEFYDPALKRRNLADVRLSGEFHFRQGDIRRQDEMRRIIGDWRPESIVHLAARAGVRPSLADPLLYEDVNVRGTMVLLEACREFSIPKFVFASSSSIYGATNRVPFGEDDPLNLPISPYAATKLAGEKICYTYSHLYRIGVVCLRFFTVYGPRQRPDLAIRKFTQLIWQGKPVPYFGDGTSSRDYTFVEDTVQGIMSALDHDCAYDVFNLGNSHPVSLAEMVRAIEEALGKRAELQQLPDQPGDVPITFADIGKAQRLLGYSPTTPFREGILRFAEWFQRSQAAGGAASAGPDL
jgi:UDP-glucuronate 4-epimerase